MKSKKWALLIGIDDYEHVSRLKFARTDVKAFGEALKMYCNFDEVQVFTDEGMGKMHTTHNGIIGALENLSFSIKPEDTFLFYFAGHGIVRKEESYLLGVNADISSDRRTAMTSVPLNMLRDALRDIPALQKVLILDACRNEPEAGRNGEANYLQETMWAGFRDIVVKRVSEGNKYSNPTAAVLFACDVGQRAYEWAEKKHSVFNYYLLEAIKGKSANARGEIEFGSVAAHVQEQMKVWSKRNPNMQQYPIYELKGEARLLIGRIKEEMIDEYELYKQPPPYEMDKKKKVKENQQKASKIILRIKSLIDPIRRKINSVKKKWIWIVGVIVILISVLFVYILSSGAKISQDQIILLNELKALSNFIVFSSNRDGNYEIYKMAADGSKQQRLTYTSYKDIQPSVSPDGKKIAFSSLRFQIFGPSSGSEHWPERSYDIYVMNSDGSNPTKFSDVHYADLESPVWSFDGREIAFRILSTWHFLTVDEGEKHPGRNPEGELTHNNYFFKFKDEYDILIVNEKSYTLHSRWGNIYVEDGKGTRVKLANIGDNITPAWGPPLPVLKKNRKQE